MKLGDVGDRRHPAELDREDQHQDGGEKELRNRDDAQRHDGHDPVEERIPKHRSGSADDERERHGKDGRSAREQQRMQKPRTDQFAVGQAVDERNAEIAGQEPTQPTEIANIGSLIEA